MFHAHQNVPSSQPVRRGRVGAVTFEHGMMRDAKSAASDRRPLRGPLAAWPGHHCGRLLLLRGGLRLAGSGPLVADLLGGGGRQGRRRCQWRADVLLGPLLAAAAAATAAAGTGDLAALCLRHFPCHPGSHCVGDGPIYPRAGGNGYREKRGELDT